MYVFTRQVLVMSGARSVRLDSVFPTNLANGAQAIIQLARKWCAANAEAEIWLTAYSVELRFLTCSSLTINQASYQPRNFPQRLFNARQRTKNEINLVIN
jgi:hypothetical protein